MQNVMSSEWTTAWDIGPGNMIMENKVCEFEARKCAAWRKYEIPA